ncbi:hypothetical protein G9A89_005331 [Geosiphon pyriformis]|nr:hypothetical protein G9A89_005331 [Geosiphon pyriformis]
MASLVKSFFERSFFNIQYNKTKPFFDFETTIGPIIAVIKKTIKGSGSEDGFKTVALRKKREGGVLKKSIDNKGVVAKAPGVCLWSSETSDTMESESIDMEKKCLVEETSVNYGKSGSFAEGDPDHIPKGLRVKTRKCWESRWPSIQVSVCKSFALDIDLMAVAEKFFQKKLSFVRKIFSGVNGFGRASTSSKFGELAIMTAGKLAHDCGVVVNTNLKCSGNNHTNQTIVLKEIPVRTSLETVQAVMQLVDLWQKAIIEMEDLNQSILIRKDVVCMARANVNKQTWDYRDEFRALLYILFIRINAHNLWNFFSLVGGKTCIIGCNFINYTHVHCATVGFEFEKVFLQTMANTLVIRSVNLHWLCLFSAVCSFCGFLGHISLVCKSAGAFSISKSKKTPILAQDWFRLARIYKRKSAPIFCPLAFDGKTWVLVVSSSSLGAPHEFDSQLDSIENGKLLSPVVNDLERHLVCIESSLVIEQIGELAKRLESFMPAVSQSSSGCQLLVTPLSQNQGEDIVIEVGSGNATSNKTAAILDLTASPEVVKLENMLEGLSASVNKIAMCNVYGLNNPVKQDDVIYWHKDMNNLVSIFMESKLKEKVHPWLADKFDSVWVFTSGLDSGSLGAEVLIVVNSSLAKHVCKVFEVPSWLLSIKLLFKNKLSVSILGLYAGASSVVWFSQAGEINSLIAKAVNESSFVILGGDFNKDSSHKCASFKKCFDLDLINFLEGSSFVKSPTWCNSHGITKTIDYVFVSFNLVGAMVDRGVDGIGNYFDTNYKTVYVSVRLSGLLDKYDIKDASEIKWSEFRNATAANAVIFLDEFVTAKQFSNLDVSFWFHKLELLVSKLVKASRLVYGRDFASLLDTWNKLNSVNASLIRSLFFSGTSFDAIHSRLAKARKSYCSSKLLESKCAEESCIRQAIERRMESFEVDKGHTIRSVLEHSFCKVVLDYLVNSGELALEPEFIKSKIDEIMKG